MVTSGGKVSLVGGDAEAVDLGVRMLDCARTDTRQSLPESDSMIISSCAENDRHCDGGGLVA